MVLENTIREVRSFSEEAKLIELARASPSAWVYDIDWDYRPDQRVPAEAIRGAWEVDGEGKLTGVYDRNPRYRPIEHCERTLKRHVHAAARVNPDLWIVEVDPRGEVFFPEIPKELIRGWWYVDSNGIVTDMFRENSLWKGERE